MKLAKYTPVKFLCALLTILSITAIFATTPAVYELIRYNAYTLSEADYIQNRMLSQFWMDMNAVESYYAATLNRTDCASEIAYYKDRFSQDNSNFFFTVTEPNSDHPLLRNYGANVSAQFTDSMETWIRPQISYWEGYLYHIVNEEEATEDYVFYWNGCEYSGDSLSDVFRSAAYDYAYENGYYYAGEYEDLYGDCFYEEWVWKPENAAVFSDGEGDNIFWDEESGLWYTISEDGSYWTGLLPTISPTETVELESKHVVITGSIRSDLYAGDSYMEITDTSIQLYSLRYYALAGLCAGAVVLVLSLVVLIYGAGRRKNSDAIALRLMDRIPWDVFLVLLLIPCVAAIGCGFSPQFNLLLSSGFRYPAQLLWLTGVGLGFGVLFTLFIASFSARLKTKGWWKNSLILLLLKELGHLIKLTGRAIGRGVAKLGEVWDHPLRRLKKAFLDLPLVWKTVGICVLLFVLEVICLNRPIVWFGSPGALFWLFFSILLYCILIAVSLTLKRLQAAGKALAGGDLDYQVDTQHMWGDFAAHGENLNRIREGIALAVEEQLKSERMKTELITNVSHDLKTPLTSIVSYVDLLSKLDLSEEAAGYVEVLQRQSARLKKLTEDLVEASKASAGTLPVEIVPVDLSELLQQVTGEYADRFETQHLTSVLQLPEEAITVLGDTRCLWRVLDNLMGNVRKYAMEGTRVYIDGSVQGENAVITIKNISRERLNISADELMERFVRGDASRNTEGSGLGLSIAQSLCALMGGRLEITVDGDLFKAAVYLPISK